MSAMTSVLILKLGLTVLVFTQPADSGQYRHVGYKHIVGGTARTRAL